MTVNDFIAKWAGVTGGAERANLGQFINDLCQALELPLPGVAEGGVLSDYQFEGPVQGGGAGGNTGAIDLYKRGCFVLEGKQSRLLPIRSTIMPGVGKMENQTNNPMQPERLAQTPRCLAMTRKGTACQSPAVRGSQRCRMHGGKGSGAPRGSRNAWKHGGRSAETEGAARYLKAMAHLIAEAE